jgi:hypothetical protein
MERWANVSIDLDGLGCYHTIHSIDREADPTAIYEVALPRFLALCDRFGVRATLFVIASDLEYPAVVTALREARDAGHEIASHSYSHAYDLRSHSWDRVVADFDRAEAEFMTHFGERPVGFRTPGYNVDTRLLRLLSHRGYRYDSSVFPCPAYYAAKGAVMGVMRLAGRPSGSAMTRAEALLAPIQPYRPAHGAFWRPGRNDDTLPLWEFPVGVVRGSRFPVIGTTLGALPPAAARALYHAHSFGQRLVELEFHGIDFLDARDPCIDPALAARQPDVRRAVDEKFAAFSAYFAPMTSERTVLTLAALCDRLDA